MTMAIWPKRYEIVSSRLRYMPADLDCMLNPFALRMEKFIPTFPKPLPHMVGSNHANDARVTNRGYVEVCMEVSRCRNALDLNSLCFSHGWLQAYHCRLRRIHKQLDYDGGDSPSILAPLLLAPMDTLLWKQ